MQVLSNNLGTFRTLYIVKGILNIMFSLFFILYAVLGIFLMSNMDDFSNASNELGFNPGIIFIIIGSIGIFISLLFGILTLVAAKYLKEARNYNFIFVIAILNCLTGVLGILLGVFTIIELNKPHVKELFKSKT